MCTSNHQQKITVNNSNVTRFKFSERNLCRGPKVELWVYCLCLKSNAVSIMKELTDQVRIKVIMF